MQKQILSDDEKHYSKVVTSIGITLLVFYLNINLVGILTTVLQQILIHSLLSPVAVNLIFQLVYGAGYLLSFMCPVFVLRALVKKSGYLYHPMKTEIRPSKYLFPIIVGGITLVLVQAYFNSALVSIFDYSSFSEEVLWQGNAERPQPYQLVLTFISLCMVPAFCEEFLFRGAILTNLLPFGRGLAILISSLLFSMMHQNAEQILYTFGAGIVLGIIYERTGSIWNCVFLHMMNNFSSLFMLAVSERIDFANSETVYIIVQTVLAVLGVICIAFLVTHMAPKKQDFRDGVFGKTVEASDGYASCPVTRGKAYRLFFNVPMTIFLALCVVQIIGLLLMAVTYVG